MQGYKFIANLGDVNFLEHGGFLVYQSETDPLDVRCVVIETEEDESSPILEYGFSADLCFRCENGIDVSDNEFHKNHPAWFSKDLESVASYCGIEKSDLVESLFSEDPIARSIAYREIASYFGTHEFDQYPINHTQAEAEERFTEELKTKL